MLVLSRNKDESIMINDDIEITIVDIRGDKVRLGIAAPKGVTVHRKEVWEAIQKEKKQGLIDLALKEDAALDLEVLMDQYEIDEQDKERLRKLFKR
jgi:carbon storage regulator